MRMNKQVRIMEAPDGAFEAWIDHFDHEEGYVHIRTVNLRVRKGDVIYPFVNGLDRRLVVTDGPLLY